MKLKESRIILTLSVSALFCVLLTFPAFGSSPPSESDSVTITLHIPVIQELSMSAAPGYKDKIRVQEETDTQARTTITLDGSSAGLTEEEVLLDDALEVEILSNVNWQLVASVEARYLNYSGVQLSSNPQPNIWARADAGSFVKLANLDKGIISGGGLFQRQGFGISYRIGLPQKEGAEITGAGAEVLYTLMRL